MPQKKTPMCRAGAGQERPRGGAFDAVLPMLMKGQPLAYNKDNQGQGGTPFDCADTLSGMHPSFRRYGSGPRPPPRHAPGSGHFRLRHGHGPGGLPRSSGPASAMPMKWWGGPWPVRLPLSAISRNCPWRRSRLFRSHRGRCLRRAYGGRLRWRPGPLRGHRAVPGPRRRGAGSGSAQGLL